MVLVLLLIFQNGNLKDCLMKVLNILLHLMIIKYCLQTRAKFNESCLKQDKITYTHRTIVNIYIVYELTPNVNNFDFTLENCLFEAIK